MLSRCTSCAVLLPRAGLEQAFVLGGEVGLGGVGPTSRSASRKCTTGMLSGSADSRTPARSTSSDGAVAQHDLRHTAAVAHEQERHRAQPSAAVHPALDRHPLPDPVGQLPASVRNNTLDPPPRFGSRGGCGQSGSGGNPFQAVRDRSTSQASTRASSGRRSSTARAATVKNAGVGTRPDSILRRVSTGMPTAAATDVMERAPRASRNTVPRRRPRSCSSGVNGTRTMTVILIPV